MIVETGAQVGVSAEAKAEVEIVTDPSRLHVKGTPTGNIGESLQLMRRPTDSLHSKRQHSAHKRRKLLPSELLRPSKLR